MEFLFIFDKESTEYSLWWEGFKHRLGTLQEVAPGLWKCCPQWQAAECYGLQYREIKASSKEGAALAWLVEVDLVEKTG